MIDISPYKFNQPNGTGKKDWVHVVSEDSKAVSNFDSLIKKMKTQFISNFFQTACPDVYRGKYRDIDYPGEDMGVKYAEDVKRICTSIKSKGKGVQAFIAESLISVGGQILPPRNYFKNVYK